MSKFNFMG